MAVNIKMTGKANITAWTVLKSLQIPVEDIEWLRQSALKVSLKSSVLSFQVPSVDNSGTVDCFNIGFGLIELAQLSQGKLAPAKLAVLSHQTKAAIAEIKDKYALHLANVVPALNMYSGTVGKLPPLKSPGSYEEAVAQVSKGTPPGGAAIQYEAATTAVITNQSWPTFDVTKIKTADLVKLRDANQMYQPVQGSSAGSRYFLVGANQHLRIAARFIKGTLSVRIEGPNWAQYKKEIEAIGFSKMSKAESYASVHFEIGHDIQLANKTLGAVLTGLGVSLETPIPNLSVTQ